MRCCHCWMAVGCRAHLFFHLADGGSSFVELLSLSFIRCGLYRYRYTCTRVPVYRSRVPCAIAFAVTATIPFHGNAPATSVLPRCPRSWTPVHMYSCERPSSKSTELADAVAHVGLSITNNTTRHTRPQCGCSRQGKHHWENTSHDGW